MRRYGLNVPTEIGRKQKRMYQYCIAVCLTTRLRSRIPTCSGGNVNFGVSNQRKARQNTRIGTSYLNLMRRRIFANTIRHRVDKSR